MVSHSDVLITTPLASPDDAEPRADAGDARVGLRLEKGPSKGVQIDGQWGKAKLLAQPSGRHLRRLARIVCEDSNLGGFGPRNRPERGSPLLKDRQTCPSASGKGGAQGLVNGRGVVVHT